MVKNLLKISNISLAVVHNVCHWLHFIVVIYSFFFCFFLFFLLFFCLFVKMSQRYNINGLAGIIMLAALVNTVCNSLSLLCNLSRDARKPVFGFPTGSDTNWPVQPQKMARCLKFWI